MKPPTAVATRVPNIGLPSPLHLMETADTAEDLAAQPLSASVARVAEENPRACSAEAHVLQASVPVACEAVETVPAETPLLPSIHDGSPHPLLLAVRQGVSNGDRAAVLSGLLAAREANVSIAPPLLSMIERWLSQFEGSPDARLPALDVLRAQVPDTAIASAASGFAQSIAATVPVIEHTPFGTSFAQPSAPSETRQVQASIGTTTDMGASYVLGPSDCDLGDFAGAIAKSPSALTCPALGGMTHTVASHSIGLMPAASQYVPPSTGELTSTLGLQCGLRPAPADSLSGSLAFASSKAPGPVPFVLAEPGPSGHLMFRNTRIVENCELSTITPKTHPLLSPGVFLEVRPPGVSFASLPTVAAPTSKASPSSQSSALPFTKAPGLISGLSSGAVGLLPRASATASPKGPGISSFDELLRKRIAAPKAEAQKLKPEDAPPSLEMRELEIMLATKRRRLAQAASEKVAEAERLERIEQAKAEKAARLKAEVEAPAETDASAKQTRVSLFEEADAMYELLGFVKAKAAIGKVGKHANGDPSEASVHSAKTSLADAECSAAEPPRHRESPVPVSPTSAAARVPGAAAPEPPAAAPEERGRRPLPPDGAEHSPPPPPDEDSAPGTAPPPPLPAPLPPHGDAPEAPPPPPSPEPLEPVPSAGDASDMMARVMAFAAAKEQERQASEDAPVVQASDVTEKKDPRHKESWEYLQRDQFGVGNFFDFNSF